MDKTGETSSDETLGMRATKSPQLCGAYISEFGPIHQQYLDLAPGLNCLYGVNGAGKSQILSCLVKSLENSNDLISSDYAYETKSFDNLIISHIGNRAKRE